MTNAIRAASIASNLGELRISTNCIGLPKELKPQDEQKLTACWKQDLSKSRSEGEAITKLDQQLTSRGSPRRSSRIDLIAEAMSSSKYRTALKVTIHYKILLGSDAMHYGGIHALTSKQTPHIYTTAGVFGDHEGPRSWIPTLDSASTDHRASHDITIKVTAPMREGLSVVGFGEDYGASEMFIHHRPSSQNLLDAKVQKELGFSHVHMLHQIAEKQAAALKSNNSPHLIPPDQFAPTLSIDSLLTTCVWSSASWLPVPTRAIGFAIGPFRVLEDPEFFDTDAADNSDEASQLRAEIEEARRNGEGIRQVSACTFVCVF
jgi:hypothetical protein